MSICTSSSAAEDEGVDTETDDEVEPDEVTDSLAEERQQCGPYDET